MKPSYSAAMNSSGNALNRAPFGLFTFDLITDPQGHVSDLRLTKLNPRAEQLTGFSFSAGTLASSQPDNAWLQAALATARSGQCTTDERRGAQGWVKVQSVLLPDQLLL